MAIHIRDADDEIRTFHEGFQRIGPAPGRIAPVKFE
jgi:hypothetical protein